MNDTRELPDLERCYAAMANDDMAEFERLLAGGVGLNKTFTDEERNTWTLMELAVRLDRADFVKALLKAGASPKPSRNRPFMSEAAINGNFEILEALLDAGADPNGVYREGKTALFGASTPDIVKLLISRGADVNHQNDRGWTPLINHAFGSGLKSATRQYDRDETTGKWVERPQPEETEEEKERPFKMLAVLLENGADVNHKDKDGKTALTWATSKRAKEMLLDAGARQDG